jgi:hypothetical protein
MVIDFNEQELNVLISIIDQFIRAHGLRGAGDAVYMAKKIEDAVAATRKVDTSTVKLQIDDDEAKAEGEVE